MPKVKSELQEKLRSIIVCSSCHRNDVLYVITSQQPNKLHILLYNPGILLECVIYLEICKACLIVITHTF